MLVTPNLPEAVRHAGGWLFDQGMAGWDVTVLRADRADARPLRILGARVAHLEPVLASPVRGPWPQAIAVHMELYGSDPRVRRMVHDALDDGSADVSFWGGHRPAEEVGGAAGQIGVAAGRIGGVARQMGDPAGETGGTAGPLHHRLSMAARAFKAQAMAAAALTAGPHEPVETFHDAEPLRQSAGG